MKFLAFLILCCSELVVSQFEPVLSGIVAAPFTPLNDDFSINLHVISAYADYLMKSGVYSVFICGTTGESLSLTTQERMEIAEKWIQSTKHIANFRVVVHVGAESARDVSALAAHAQAQGAYAVGMMPPTFFKPSGIPGLLAWCEDAARAAPTLPFFYYHIPSMTGVNVNIHDFLDAALGRIPNFAGVKFTDYDLYDFSRSVHYGKSDGSHGPFTMLFGRDEVLLGGLVMHADGLVGSTYNYLGKAANALLASFKENALTAASDIQVKIQNVVVLLGKYGGCTGKAIMQLVGIACGPCRPPMMSLTSDQLQKLHADLVALGFFTWSTPAPADHAARFSIGFGF